MLKKELEKIAILEITLPEHKFIHVKSKKTKGYWEFWEQLDKTPGMVCDLVAGLLDSISGKFDSISKIVGEFDGQIGRLVGIFILKNY